MTNDGLYTDSTLAINVDTGKLVWFFQHQPNDQWDYDWAFERHVLPLRVNGAEKTLVVTGGKQAIFDAMEAATGKYAFSIDLGVQNVVTAIDPKTGAKTIDPRLVPGDGETKFVCPHAGGAKSWLPSSYNPRHEDAVRPARRVVHGSDAGGAGRARQPLDRRALEPAAAARTATASTAGCRPSTSRRSKSVWIERQRAPQTTGTLATAGGVVFAGALDRVVRCLRRHDREGAVADATGRRAEQRADQLPRQRQAVRRDDRRQRRRAGDHVPGARAGDQESAGSWRRRCGCSNCQAGDLGLSALGSRLELRTLRIPDPGSRIPSTVLRTERASTSSRLPLS